MAYAIITGAHLFPYAWFYDEIGYAITAILISVGSLLIALNVESEKIWFVPLFTSIMLFLFAGWIFIAFKKLKKNVVQQYALVSEILVRIDNT